jgi:hypothetical protein
MTSGCSASSTTEDATTTVSQAVETSSDSTDAIEVSSLLRGMNGLHTEAVEGFHCDASPDITYVDVCGQSLPATVHLEWTDCAAPARPGGGGGGHHGGPPPGGAGGAPAPGGTGGDMGGTCPAGSDGGMAPPDGAGGPMHGPSSGTVDITNTYDAPVDCRWTARAT